MKIKLFFLFSCVVIFSCVGSKPEIRAPKEKDVFTFQVDYSYVTVHKVDEWAKQKIFEIMGKHGYQDYKILEATQKNPFFLRKTYKVKFFVEKRNNE